MGEAGDVDGGMPSLVQHCPATVSPSHETNWFLVQGQVRYPTFMDAGATFVEKGGLSVVTLREMPAIIGGFCFDGPKDDRHSDCSHGDGGSLLGVIFDWSCLIGLEV
jgi:hypothetical protein